MICKKCSEDQHEKHFAIVLTTSTYTKKDGTVSSYSYSARRKTCNKCVYKGKKGSMFYRQYKSERIAY